MVPTEFRLRSAGGMGEVYNARDTRLDRSVAKVRNDPRMLDLLRRMGPA